MLLVIALSAVCAAVVFFLAQGIGRAFVNRVYMSDDAIASRKSRVCSELSSYAYSHKVYGSDSAAIAEWSARYEYINVYVYARQESSGQNTAPRPSSPGQFSGTVAEYDNRFGKLYNIRFYDAVYAIAISDTSQLGQYSVCRVVAIIAACIVFVLVMFQYMRTLTERIVSLASEAAVIGRGELDAPITSEGDDEIAVLGREMDRMRRSVIEKMGNESRAWEANAELITAISHDIRTPMTSLLGYLSLLTEGNSDDAERNHRFASSAYSKALELKDLTDEMFRYFLVFGKSDLKLNSERFQADVLIPQMLAEAAFDLQDTGFRLQFVGDPGNGFIETDPLYLKRVFDNIVSNIKKYADPERPVMVITEQAEDRISVCFSNNIRKSMDKVESTKIGMRTCEKILEKMGGSFTVSTDRDHYAAELSLPLRRDEE